MWLKIAQNARNCTIFKNFLGGAYPQTPLAKARSFAARDKIPEILKLGPPPLTLACLGITDRFLHSPYILRIEMGVGRGSGLNGLTMISYSELV